MKLRTWVVGAFAYTLSLTSMHAATVTNGSFESPGVPNGGFTDFAAGSGSLTGWTVVGVDVAIVSTNYPNSRRVGQPVAGSDGRRSRGRASPNPLRPGPVSNTACHSGLETSPAFQAPAARSISR